MLTVARRAGTPLNCLLPQPYRMLMTGFAQRRDHQGKGCRMNQGCNKYLFADTTGDV
jgi:hypothetical protein